MAESLPGTRRSIICSGPRGVACVQMLPDFVFLRHRATSVWIDAKFNKPAVKRLIRDPDRVFSMKDASSLKTRRKSKLRALQSKSLECFTGYSSNVTTRFPGALGYYRFSPDPEPSDRCKARRFYKTPVSQPRSRLRRWNHVAAEW